MLIDIGLNKLQGRNFTTSTIDFRRIISQPKVAYCHFQNLVSEDRYSTICNFRDYVRGFVVVGVSFSFKELRLELLQSALFQLVECFWHGADWLQSKTKKHMLTGTLQVETNLHQILFSVAKGWFVFIVLLLHSVFYKAFRYKMNKEFSFYEFSGIIAPSVIFLFFFDLMLKKTQSFSLFDFSNLGESIVFIVIAYGVGHVLQSFGYYLEKPVWWLLNGRPTDWLLKKPRLWQKLFEEGEAKQIIEKLQKEFGESDEKNYGRLAYTKIYVERKSDRIEIFNGNYSLFRGLAVCFLLLMITALYLKFGQWHLFPLFLFCLSIIRMVHFGKCYATEVYRTFFMLKS